MITLRKHNDWKRFHIYCVQPVFWITVVVVMHHSFVVMLHVAAGLSYLFLELAMSTSGYYICALERRDRGRRADRQVCNEISEYSKAKKKTTVV